MSHRYYFSPIIHCPSLCPYHPPKGLFLDDYDPDREEIAWKFCTEHCWLASESERACMIEHARLRAEARKRGIKWEDAWLFGDKPARSQERPAA